jgi:tetratricopeptide (TPR) repeat protein
VRTPWKRLSLLGCLGILTATTGPSWGETIGISGNNLKSGPGVEDDTYFVSTDLDTRGVCKFGDGSLVELAPGTRVEFSTKGRPRGSLVRLIANEAAEWSPFSQPIPDTLKLRQGQIWAYITQGHAVTTVASYAVGTSHLARRGDSANTGDQNTVSVRVSGDPAATSDRVGPIAAAYRTGEQRYAAKLSISGAGKDSITVRVGKGSAGVRSDQFPKAPVPLGPGQQTVVRRGAKPSAPKAVAINLPFLLEWLADTQPIEFTLEPRFVDGIQEQRDLDAALRAAEALPPGPERWRGLGDTRHDRHERQEAVDAYAAAAMMLGSEPPGNALAFLKSHLGQTLLEMGRLSDAEAAFRQSLEILPESPETHARLAVTLLNRQETKEALAEARLAVEQLRAASRVRLASDEPTAAPEAHLALALALIRAGDRDAAHREVLQALSLNRDYSQAHAWRSFILDVDGRVDDAKEEAEYAITLARTSVLAINALSDALFASGKIRQAHKEAERAAEMDPGSAAARVRIGRALLQQGKVEQAISVARKAVQLRPDLERGQFLLGVALAERRDLDAAVGPLQQAVQLDREYTEARAFLGRVYLEQGRKREARDLALTDAPRDGEDASALASQGRVYWRTGNFPEAARNYRQALELSPASPLFNLELARVYLDQNDLPDALHYGLEAVALVPNASEAHAMLGLVYERQGNLQQAEREYREAISLSPDASLARLGLVAAFTPSSFGTFDSGQERLREYSQALLRQPSVLEETFKPDKTSEISSAIGTDRIDEQQYLHRGESSRGRLHDLSVASRFSVGSFRPNSDSSGWDLHTDLAIQATPRTQVLAQYLEQRLSGSLPEAVDDFNTGGHSFRQRTDVNLSLRQYVGDRTFIWLRHGIRLFRNRRKSRHNPRPQPDLYPDSDSTDEFRAILKSDLARDERSWELRLDHSLGWHRLTYGFMILRDDVRSLQSVRLGDPRETPDRDDEESGRTRDFLQYIQDDCRLGGAGSLVIGTQFLRASDRATRKKGTGAPRNTIEANHHFLPYLELTHSLGSHSLARLLGYKTRIRFGGSLLAPSEAFIVGEPVDIFYNGQLETYEFDYEHRFSLCSFVKLFVQYSGGSEFSILPTKDQSIGARRLIIPRVREQILGFRYERQINRHLSGFTRLVYTSAEDQSRFAYYSDGNILNRMPNPSRELQVPFSPRWRGLFGLNYVDGSGTKFSLVGVDFSRQFIDVVRINTNFGFLDEFGGSQFDRKMKRRSMGTRARFDLGIAKETFKEGWEYGLTVSNLFNARWLDWPDFPLRGRVWMLNGALRF